jgi:synaptojanin
LEEYSVVHAVNLLGTKDSEAALSAAYNAHLKTLEAGLENGDDSSSILHSREGSFTSSGDVNLGITNFDFHNAVRMEGHDSVIRQLRRLDGVRIGIERFGYTTTREFGADFGMGVSDLITEQSGVFRTNCLDW